MGLGGKKRSEKAAHDIVRDISKMLYYHDPKELNWGNITKKQLILTYMEVVENLGVGAEGQLGKLERLCDAYQFLKRKCNDTWNKEMAEAEVEIVGWKKTLRKEKNALNMMRLEKTSELEVDLNIISDIVDNQEMWLQFSNTVDRVRLGEDVPESELKLAMSIVLVSVKLKSLQRPGAVVNCTMDEYNNATTYDDIMVIKVLDHKTKNSGTAKLTLDSQLMARLKLYVQYIRPQLVEPGHDVNFLFILPGSRKIEKIGNIEKFLERHIKVSVPTSTMARKIGATCAVKNLDYNDHTLINKQMSHSAEVSSKYYEAIRGPRDAAQAFKTMESLRQKCTPAPTRETEEVIRMTNPRWSEKDAQFVEKKFFKLIHRGITPTLDACRNLGLDKNPKQVWHMSIIMLHRASNYVYHAYPIDSRQGTDNDSTAEEIIVD